MVIMQTYTAPLVKNILWLRQAQFSRIVYGVYRTQSLLPIFLFPYTSDLCSLLPSPIILINNIRVQQKIHCLVENYFGKTLKENQMGKLNFN